MKNYYHLTDCKNAPKIIQEGIKSDRYGQIFVFTDMLVANPIAKEQVFTTRYSVFEIDRKGICGKILKDNAGEFTEKYHKIIKQKLIKPKFLKLICEKDTIHFEPTEWDYYRGQHLWGKTRNEIDKQFSEYKKKYEGRAAMSEEEQIRALANDLNTDPDALAQRIQFFKDMPDNSYIQIVGEGAEIKVVIEEDEYDRAKK